MSFINQREEEKLTLFSYFNTALKGIASSPCLPIAPYVYPILVSPGQPSILLVPLRVPANFYPDMPVVLSLRLPFSVQF